MWRYPEYHSYMAAMLRRVHVRWLPSDDVV